MSYENYFVQKVACIVLAQIIFIAGCAGSASDLKKQYRPDDEKKSCKKLSAEITSIEKAIAEKQRKIREFEEDLSEYRRLEGRLRVIYADKNCQAAGSIERVKERMGVK